MQKKKRIRLRAVGKRLRRLTVYSITFIGVLLFGALNGVRGKESLSRFIITAIPVVVLGFFLIKHSLDRSISPMQVRETTEAYPDASPDELYAECDRLRRREIRLDALMLVIFAGFTLNWMLMLYLADASPLALQFDLWIMLPALLLVAAVLLIVSWIPPRKRTKIPLLEQYLNDAEQQKILLERKDKPDRRYAGCTLLIKETEEVPTMESAISAVRTAFSERRRKLMLPQRLGIGFLVITPGVLFLFTLPMLLFDGPSEISWIALLFGGLTIGGIALMISVRTYDSTFPYSSRKTKKLIRALYRQGHLEPDRVLSVLPDMEMVSTLEICFENAGLIRWKETDDPTYKRLLKAAGTEASVLMSSRELLAVFLNRAPAAEQSEELRVPVAAVAEEAPTAEETPVEASVPEAAEPSAPEPSVQKTAPAPETTPVQETPANDPALAMILKILEDGGVPTDEQLREAGRIRFETMDPTKRKTYEDDLRELNQLTEMRGDQMTPAMQQRWVDLLFRSNRRESGEHRQDHLL